MKKLVSRGLVFVAALACVPAAVPPRFSPAAFIRKTQDPRLEPLRNFFARFDCPAIQYASAFLEAADRYALDWRLLPSISYVESEGGKTAQNNNLFGWGNGRAKFVNPRAGIHAVASRLAHGRRYRGKTLDEKLAIYNPKHGYARRIKSVMQRIAPAE